jgi:hypothetical protein
MGLCVGEQRLRSRSAPFLCLSRSVGDMVADNRPGIVTEFVTSTYPARISAQPVNVNWLRDEITRAGSCSLWTYVGVEVVEASRPMGIEGMRSR